MIHFRPYCDADIPFLIKYLNDPYVTQYLTSAIPQPYTHADAEYWVHQSSRQMGAQAIEYNGTYAGDIGAVRGHFDRAHSAELGYWLARDYWGKGIATAAITLQTQQLFATTPLVRIAAHVFQGNTASCRVLEKCGYTQEALLKQAAFKNGRHFDVFLYAKVKNQVASEQILKPAN